MINKLQLPFECQQFDSALLNGLSESTVIPINNIIAFALCTQGSVTVDIDDVVYHISKGDVFFLPPSLYAKINYVSTDLAGIIIYVDYDFMMSMVNKVMDIRSALYFADHPYMSLTVSQYETLHTMMQNLIHRIEVESVTEASEQYLIVLRELIISMCNTLAYEVINFYLQSHRLLVGDWDRTDKIVQEFIVNVYHNFRKHREVAYYAEQLCITPAYLSSLVKEKTGKPALQWIIDIVISEARQLLQYTDMSVKEIATTLSFPTQSPFGKYFKQYVGKSPKEFRAKLRNVQ